MCFSDLKKNNVFSIPYGIDVDLILARGYKVQSDVHGNEKNMKVLIVDDVRANRMLLSAVVKSAGHDVAEAQDGLEAIKEFDKYSPDLILMDVMMPNLNGFEAAKKIKQMAKNKWVPIVFVTAVKNEDASEENIAEGDDYLLKPIDKKMVLARLASIEKALRFQKEAVMEHERAEEALERLSEETTMAFHVSERLMGSETEWNGAAKRMVKASGMFSGDAVWIERTPCGAIRGFLADAAGHGMASCLNVMPLAPIFSAMTKKGFPLVKIVGEMTKTIKKLFPLERFVAGTLVNVDENRGLLEVWQGGNPLVLHFDSKGKLKGRFESKNAPLGIGEEEWEIVVERAVWEKGDHVVAFSDGYTESFGSFSDAYLSIVRMSAVSKREAFFETLVNVIKNETLLDDASILWLGGFGAKSESCESEVNEENRDLSLSFTLRTSQLRLEDPLKVAEDIIKAMGGAKAIENPKFSLVFGELFSNAFEHGVLALSSTLKEQENGFENYEKEKLVRIAKMTEGWIRISVSTENSWDNIKLTVEDSGPGFVKEFDGMDLSAVMSSGRGLQCLSGICKEWNHMDGSSIIETII